MEHFRVINTYWNNHWHDYAAYRGDLTGHASVETTMIYLHVLKRPGAGAASPLDFLP